MLEPPIDPDVDLRTAPSRRELPAHRWSVLGAISAGGVIGALARYGLQYAFPHAATGFGWATFVINVSGCLLIGILMVLVTDVWPNQRLLRPFAGVGILGGFTTFSTYAVDIEQAITAGAAVTAFVYLAATLIGALAAVWLGSTAARAVVNARRST